MDHNQSKFLGHAMQELSADYNVVVNCAGLGGGALVGQADTFPIRGHVIRVRAPWIKSAYFCGSNYILPNQHNVVIGGTGDEGDHDQSPRQKDRDSIWEGCLKILPSLARVGGSPSLHPCLGWMQINMWCVTRLHQHNPFCDTLGC